MRDLCLRTVAILAVLVGLLTLGRGEADLAGGTQISGYATATFEDAAGHAYQTQSNTVIATIAKVAGIAVSPKETAANPATDGAPIDSTTTRTFTIANTSNIADAYKITAAQAASPLTIVSMNYLTPSGLIPVTLGGTVSPTVQPGGVITLQIALGTANLAMGAKASIGITVQTTAGSDNGLQSDTGEQWVIGANSSDLSGPGGSGTSISKTVDKVAIVQSQADAVVTFDVVAKNSGGTPATNVVVTDPLPTGFVADLSTVTINGIAAGTKASFSNGVLTVLCGTLNAGATVDVGFSATTPNVQTLGTTFVNTAQVSADSMAPSGTTPASVLLGTANIVFDGYAGGSRPISGATVTLLDASGNVVNLGSSQSSTELRKAQGTGISSSSNTANPLITGADGTYGFALSPSQIAPGGSTFTLELDAPGYLNRRIKLTITPGADGMLYDVASVALDGQPIAQAGGFTLIKSQMELRNVFGLFGNVPLFRERAISVTKTADRSTAQPGDRVRYEVDFSNSTTDAIGATQVIDAMPPGIVYAPGTALLDGVAAEPQIDGQTLTWSLPELDGGQQHKITYDAVVYPTAAAGSKLTNSVTVNGNIPGTIVTASGASSVTVQVVAGAITQRRPILGRVFVDTARTGHFHKGDKGIAGVRIYLEDGSSVVTDADGRFSFPSARPGMHVLRLDTTTLPSGVHAYPDQRMNSTHALQQLVHGILDDGILDDVEFALES